MSYAVFVTYYTKNKGFFFWFMWNSNLTGHLAFLFAKPSNPVKKSNCFSFMATPEAYGSSEARGRIRAAAAGLCHSHAIATDIPQT